MVSEYLFFKRDAKHWVGEGGKGGVGRPFFSSVTQSTGLGYSTTGYKLGKCPANRKVLRDVQILGW